MFEPTTYDTIQERLTRLMFPSVMQSKQLTGKRAEGYREGILAAKSLIKEIMDKKGGK